MNIELHLEELVLDGFATTDRYRISAALQAEMSRLFTERGVPASLAHGGSIAMLRAEGLDVSPSASADRIGKQVARALYERLAG